MAKRGNKIKKTKPRTGLTKFQKEVLKDLRDISGAYKRKKLSGKAKAILQQLKELDKLPAKKKKSASKLARGIFNDLNKFYRKRLPPTGFAKNNFNYIRSLLWRTHKSDFAGYKDAAFIKTVNQLYNDCKPLGADCTDQAILERYAKLKEAPRRPKPFIDPDLFQPQNYFEIKDVEFVAFAPYLWIVSPMIIPSPHEFIITNYYYHYNKLHAASPEEIAKMAEEIRTKQNLGNLTKKQEADIKLIAGISPSAWTQIQKTQFLELYAKYNEDATRGYNTYFKEWVDWCNASMQSEHGATPPSDKIFFRFIEPEYNTIADRWEAQIIICTADGVAEDFGFKPTGRIEDHDIPKEYTPPLAKPLELPTPEKEATQTQDLQKRRAEMGIQNQAEAIMKELKIQEKKEKELEIRLFLLEEERKQKEIDKLSKLLKELRKSEKGLHKNLEIAQKMKDKKEITSIYAQIKKISSEIEKINDQLIKLSK